MVKDEEFEIILKLVLEHEGGKSNHPNDKGGKTNFGITQKSYDDQRKEIASKKGIMESEIPKAKDVNHLSQAEVKQYYHYQYKRYKADKIENLNTRYMYFDALVNHGPGNAALIFQQSCQLKVDKVFGKNTISVVNKMNQKELQKQLYETRKTFYNKIIQKDQTQTAFQKGWNNRNDKVRAQVERGITPNLSSSSKQTQTSAGQTQSSVGQTQSSVGQTQQNLKGIDCNVDIRWHNKITGINKNTSRFLIDNSGNIFLSDLATVLTVYYSPNLPKEFKMISFSLDPILLPNQNELTTQEKVCWPDKFVNWSVIQDTDFANVLFESDYLMKQMSLGVQADGKTPFNYPNELMQLGLKPCNQFLSSKGQQMLCRFWLVPSQCSYRMIGDKYLLDEVQVVCQARQMERVNNELRDKICQDIKDAAYQFASKFTQIYDKIAKYYPIFNRLKCLFKAVALGKWMYQNNNKINFEYLKNFSISKNNSPKRIPILKYQQRGEETTTPLYFTQVEKIQEAKKYLAEKGYPQTQANIEQIVSQIQDIKGYRTQKQVLYCQGGVDPNCQNMIESKVNSDLDTTSELDEIDVPFMLKQKCSDCERLVENNLLMLNQSKCSLHNEYTCYMCLELITQKDIDPKCCIINSNKFIFHNDCYVEYQKIVSSNFDY